jgi:hypothetical protein
MVGLYIFGGLIVVGIATLLFIQRKWSRAAKTEVRIREANIENERIEEAAKAAARGNS